MSESAEKNAGPRRMAEADPAPVPILDLDRLLRGMTPVLEPDDYAFVFLGRDPQLGDARYAGLFVEEEGTTLVCLRSEALRLGAEPGPAFRRITLRVHSSLEAVGFLARVTAVLAARGIACNAISAYHHDHLFVPAAHAEEALTALRGLSAASPFKTVP